ncbi:immunoglobulin kappa light chain-like [Alosa pseudoharengus]|uniref:immunoglobulin kappa light chain-like n=1 Tax=Alosa pseudoharengus TaxID=34774 RepID=UPI003F8CA380
MHVCFAILGLACFLIKANLSSLLTQTPGTVEVAGGSNVTLTCNHREVLTYCNAITWVKVEPLRGEVRTGTRIRAITNKQKDTCTGTLTDVSSDDAGMYYCLAVHSSVSYFGNGSKVFVAGTISTSPTVGILLPSDDVNSSGDISIPLVCLVSGADRHRVRLHWLINGEVWDGWTNSFWVSEHGSVTELTQNHIMIPVSKWEDEVNCTCLLTYAGKYADHKTVQRNGFSTQRVCYATLWLSRLVGISSSLLILVTLTVLATCAGKYLKSGL